MKQATKAHLISGPPGAGKSAYARDLAARLSAVRFCMDAWMEALFAKDLPSPVDTAWILERTARCDLVILETARATIAAGTPVVLDLGFQTRAQRAAMADGLAVGGTGVRLHLLDLDAAARWRRIEAGREARGAAFAPEMTRGMFDSLESLWEPPDPEEFSALNGCFVDAASGDARRASGP